MGHHRRHHGDPRARDRDQWLLYLSVGPTAAAYVLFTAGLRRVPAAAGIVSLLEPLTATRLGVIVFNEPLGAAGAGLLFTSLALLAASAR